LQTSPFSLAHFRAPDHMVDYMEKLKERRLLMSEDIKLKWDGFGGWSFAFLVFLILILLVVGFGVWFPGFWGA